MKCQSILIAGYSHSSRNLVYLNKRIKDSIFYHNIDNPSKNNFNGFRLVLVIWSIY